MAQTISAFKSPKKEELYLYVLQETELEELPNELFVMFGEPVHVLDFELTAERKLPRADAKEILKAIEDKGYYMQMPPNEVEKISDMTPPPEHLDNIF
ncbi:YcgL domain-containing protein [Hydrogenovibrio kuenenii]|uniref:YcgL domain-containing protein n=1 Tax=Hydrogenovibrio kuenenii TaxID=63658 RepID=UPI000463C433|nr:YcgL domain-containing protein [Hydrogenovibrio kuenenii]